MLQRVELEGSFGALRARSHRAAKGIEEARGRIEVARLHVTVEKRQRLRDGQLISIAVVTRVTVGRKYVAAADNFSVAAGPGHLQQTVVWQGLLSVDPAEQEIAAFG